MKFVQEKEYKAPKTQRDWDKAEKDAYFKPTDEDVSEMKAIMAAEPTKKRLVEEFGEQHLTEHDNGKWEIKAPGKKAVGKLIESQEKANELKAERAARVQSKIPREELVDPKTGTRYSAYEFAARNLANQKGLVPGRRRTYFFGKGMR